MSWPIVTSLAFALAMVARIDAAEVPEWGPITNGVRLSATVLPDGPRRELRILIQNVGETPVAIQVGWTNNVDRFLVFALHVSKPDGNEASFTLLPDLLISAGYLGELVVQLPPGQTYAKATHFADWNNSKQTGEKLTAVGQNGSEMWIELTSRYCGNRIPNGFQCWTGTLRSNTLQSPK